MPRVMETTVYKFDELADTAKEKARQWYREAGSGDTDWAEFTIEDAVRMAALMGIEIDTHEVTLMGGGKRQDPTVYWSLGYCQGDYAAFEGYYKYAPKAPAKLRKETGGSEGELIALAERLQALQKPLRYALTARVKYHHYYGLQIEAEANTASGASLEVSAEQEKELKEIFRDFNRWIYDRLRAEHEYQNADEQVDETIRANEYEFTEEGSIA
jgi:hypothetical protein